jgi:myo-inositol 2-dehydrogenase/D-chiro-inositol 1-dehydrogenase
VREDRPVPLTLADATEATRIGIAVTESLRTRRSVEL